MRRSVWPRVVVLAALLCIIGLTATGCTWFISIIIGLDDFFDEFAYDIQHERADALGDYYASYVFVKPYLEPSSELSRTEIVNRWRSYFTQYDIIKSRIISRTDIAEHGDIAIVDIHRYEERQDRVTYGRTRVDVFEQYTVYDPNRRPKIVSVRVESEFVTPM